MRKELKPSQGISPMPVLMIATYNDEGTVNVMNAAWGTMVEADIIALNLTETHKTVQNIRKRRAFTVSLADEAHVKEADYFGLVSGSSVSDKLSAAGLTAAHSPVVDAPVINEFPLCMECEFIEYQAGQYGLGVIGKIVRMTVDESALTNGKPDIEKMHLIAFDPLTAGYYCVRGKAADAFRAGKELARSAQS